MNKLTYQGNADSGKLLLTTAGKVVACIDDGANYAYKDIKSNRKKKLVHIIEKQEILILLVMYMDKITN